MIPSDPDEVTLMLTISIGSTMISRKKVFLQYSLFKNKRKTLNALMMHSPEAFCSWL